MVKRVVAGATLLVLAAVVLAGVGLVRAHAGVRRERVALPDAAALLAGANDADRPVRLAWINTASQPMPRSGVLDPHLDPRPNAAYVMSHPAFVLEWADGRVLLVDTGMNRQQARAFGRPIEWLSGGAAIQPHGSTAEHLGDARSRVRGVVFTHLHSDHTGGILDLCAGRDAALPVFMTEAAATRPNYTTRPGLDDVARSGCARIERLTDGAALAVGGFPGVRVIAAGGHTPCSQVVVADVHGADGDRRYVFTGDIANHIDGIEGNVPKPLLYSLLMVPEDGPRLYELRGYLHDMRERGATLLVSHDQLQLEASGVPPWR